jgi:tRNA(Arg) A34 adenosine deaminase TadA
MQSPRSGRGALPPYEELLRLALEQARIGQARGEPPFGVVIVDADGRVIAADHDRVRELGDMGAHAEVLALRAACRVRGPDLSSCTLFTTCEPCPMCYGAAWLARIGTLAYGTTMAAVAERVGPAQRELRIDVETMNAMSPEPLRLVGGIGAAACLALFAGGAGGASVQDAPVPDAPARDAPA